MLGGDLLLFLRRLRGYTQEEVACMYGVGKRTYQRWEKNESAISYDALNGIITGVFSLTMKQAVELSDYA